MRNHRRASTVLKQPRQQLKSSILLWSAFSALFCTFVVFNINVLQSKVLDLAAEAHMNASTVAEINHSFVLVVVVTVLFECLSVVAGIVLGLAMINRIFGPIVPIRRLIKSFAQGDYKARAILRKHDEFQDLMKDLNDLGATLEQRHESSQKT